MLKPTIISISMATVMAGAAISPALGLIAQAFPDASETTIKLVLTAPSLMIIPFSFLSSFLTSKITKKTIIIIGLLIYLIGGIGPQFVPSIELLLVFRLILGIGVGLVTPLAMSLINDHFEGKERTQMMGFNSAFSNLGGIITMLLAGFLATYGWRVPFNVYFLGLIILVLIIFFLPKGEVDTRGHDYDKSKMPLPVFGYALALFGTMLAFYSVATNMAMYLIQNDLGGARIAGVVISFTTLGGVIISLLLVQLELTFKQFVIPIMVAAMGIGFFFLSFTNNLVLVFLSVLLIGFAQGSLFPILTLRTLDQVKNHHADKAVAITSSFIFLGQFMSPLVLDTVSKIANTTAIRFQYGTLAVAILVVVVISIVYIARNHQDDEEKTVRGA